MRFCPVPSDDANMTCPLTKQTDYQQQKARMSIVVCKQVLTIQQQF
jgi:hypothetical protein